MKVRMYGFKDNLFKNIATLGADNNTLADRFCAFSLALSPILQFYKGIYRNAGFTILLFVFPFLIVRLISIVRHGCFYNRCLKAIIPMLLFQLFKMVDHSISIEKTLYALFFSILFIAISVGCINVRLLIKYATVISVLAGILLIIQYLCYYILGFHLQLVPISLFLPSSSGWVLGAKTGLYGIRGLRSEFYRPSAFFMEPSHLYLYIFSILCYMLFSPRMNRWRIRVSIIITLAMFLSTSGMGVAVTVGLWIVYFILYYKKNREDYARRKNVLSANNVMILIGFIILIIILYYSIPIFNKTVNRFLVDSTTGRSSAIDGRTRMARMLVSDMSANSLLFGVTESIDEIDFNLSGFFSTLYKYGWIGVVLSFWYYAQYMFSVKGVGFWISIIILVTSFFSAHTHGTFYMMYYVIFLMNALYMRNFNIENTGKEYIDERQSYMI